MFQTLRTVVIHVPDLAAAVTWYTKATGVAPYFHEPFYADYLEDDLAEILGETDFTVVANESHLVARVVVATRA